MIKLNDSKKMRILNVGCGYDTYGTDFMDLYPTRNEIIKCDVNEEKLPFKDNSFDIVYSRNLFEHLKNPYFFLKECHRVMKKGGKLEMRTDNANYWYYSSPKSVHSGLYENEGRKIGDNQKDTVEDRHYALYTEQHMRNWARSIGLKNVETIYKELEYEQLKNKFKGFAQMIIAKTLKLFPIIEKMAYPYIILNGVK